MRKEPPRSQPPPRRAAPTMGKPKAHPGLGSSCPRAQGYPLQSPAWGTRAPGTSVGHGSPVGLARSRQVQVRLCPGLGQPHVPKFKH